MRDVFAIIGLIGGLTGIVLSGVAFYLARRAEGMFKELAERRLSRPKYEHVELTGPVWCVPKEVSEAIERDQEEWWRRVRRDLTTNVYDA